MQLLKNWGLTSQKVFESEYCLYHRDQFARLKNGKT